MSDPVDPAPDPPAKSTRKALIISAIIIAVVIGAGAIANNNKGSSHSSRSSLHHVIYEVEGSATQADLTYRTATGGSSQQQAVDVPVTKKKDNTPGIESDFPGGAFLYISAQNHNDSGTITCRIKVDGVVVAENTSIGGFTIATCQGSA